MKPSSGIRTPARMLTLLLAATVLLALLLFQPHRTRLAERPAALRAPVVFDEAVVHLWK